MERRFTCVRVCTEGVLRKALYRNQPSVPTPGFCLPGCGARTSLLDFDTPGDAAAPQGCSPSPGTVTLATGSAQWFQVVVDATDAYAVGSPADDGVGPGASSLFKLPLCGGPPVIVGPAEQVLAMDATSVYSIEPDPTPTPNASTLFKLDKATGTITPLAALGFPVENLAVGPTGIYGTAGCGPEAPPPCVPPGIVFHVPLEGGPATAVVTIRGGPSNLAVDARNLYWSTGPSLMTMPLGGGPVTTISTPAGVLSSLTVQGSTLYYLSINAQAMSVSIQGGAPTPLLSGQRPLSGMALDATNLYVSLNGVIESAPLAGGPTAALGTTNTTEMTLMGIGPTTLVWGDGVNLMALTPK